MAAFDRKLIAPLILGASLNPVNSSIIAVSLVPIGRAFGAPTSQTAWLVSALYLATAIGQPVVGRLVDTFGPRRLFLTGSALTGLAGIFGTLAPTLGVLIAARVLLGFGTCAGYPAAMYLIRSEATRTGEDSPAFVLTALAVATQTIAVIGPTLGGLLIALGGWRLTLAVNIPVALTSLVIGWRRLPHITVPRTGAVELDLPGILLFAATLTALLLFLMELHPPLLAIALLAGVVLAVRELRAKEPFLDLRLLGGNLPLLATYARTLLTMTVSYSFLYGYTQWLEDTRGLSASQAGLILLPMSLIAIGVSALSGRRREVRGKLIVGSTAQLVACSLLLTLGAGSSIALCVAITAVLGLPQGLNNLANQNALYYQADPARIGSSAGLLRTFGYLGAIAASAAVGGFFGDQAGTDGLHELAIFLLAAAALFLTLTLADRSLKSVTHRSV